jgi:hypothetical protein
MADDLAVMFAGGGKAIAGTAVARRWLVPCIVVNQTVVSNERQPLHPSRGRRQSRG